MSVLPGGDDLLCGTVSLCGCRAGGGTRRLQQLGAGGGVGRPVLRLTGTSAVPDWFGVSQVLIRHKLALGIQMALVC